MDKTTIFSSSLYNIYFHPPEYLASSAIAITGSGRCSQTQPVVNRRYPDHTFVLSLSGGGMIDFRARQQELTKHDCFFIPELEIHTYGAKQGCVWDSFWLSFKAAPPIARQWKKLLPTVANFPDIRLKNLFDQIKQAYLQDQSPEYLTSILFSVMAVLRKPSQLHQSSVDEAIELAHSYIKDNLAKPLLIEDLAEKAALSGSHFSRLFKRRYGLPPMQYIISQRLSNAQMQLATTNLPIKQISRNVGFEDELYFSRLFKSKLHISPNEFRKYYNNG